MEHERGLTRPEEVHSQSGQRSTARRAVPYAGVAGPRQPHRRHRPPDRIDGCRGFCPRLSDRPRARGQYGGLVVGSQRGQRVGPERPAFGHRHPHSAAGHRFAQSAPDAQPSRHDLRHARRSSHQVAPIRWTRGCCKEWWRIVSIASRIGSGGASRSMSGPGCTVGRARLPRFSRNDSRSLPADFAARSVHQSTRFRSISGTHSPIAYSETQGDMLPPRHDRVRLTILKRTFQGTPNRRSGIRLFVCSFVPVSSAVAGPRFRVATWSIMAGGP